MTLAQHIETDLIPELNSATGLEFNWLFGEKEEQNLPESSVFPVLYLSALLTSNDTLHMSGAITSEYDLEFLFAQKSELDWTHEQHQDVIEPMRIAARKFITILQNDRANIRRIVSASRTDIQNIFDVNMSGCILKVKIQIVDGSSICV